ncbi:four helix bundle protein [Shewanella frigidimarina]|jgi:four helix bundle protein|uniref:four helix bundle protein n=1 Tax=Shewanella frigidimarina TaxID=56812 RepID=UPI000F506C22|nr:four helix bundle protein [Shewanella frigidimarina]RPA38308.1 four helix bundle protein [Shewanella frigidimarina]|tara:strand:- start:208 stop:591 length:384 start_codon:yes stop_codon:yes gene_type:complete
MRFEQLDVWKRASRLSCEIYKLADKVNNWGFKDQITRSGLSVPSNIAEGEERDTTKEKIRFLYYAKGSLGELVTQLYIGVEAGFLDKKASLILVNEAKELAKIIGTMIKNKQSKIENDRNLRTEPRV